MVAELSKLPLKELEARLGVSPDGLSKAKAQQRLEKYGFKELPETPIHCATIISE